MGTKIIFRSENQFVFRLARSWRTFSSTPSLLHATAPAVLEKNGWTSVVGLEVHAQIQTASKLFSGAASKYASPTNTLVSLFDCAVPGTLPVLNRAAVEAAILTAVALDCQVNLVSEFDRKHYFYADMPAGYQITQQRLPIASHGHLNFVVYSPPLYRVPYTKKSVIKQLQLEQDSGKSLHDEMALGSLIDLNRAGVGLMEIVFEPDLNDGEEAAALVSELIRTLEALNTCNCKMEEGSLRVDANVSVHRTGGNLGTRTEIKNLNSLRSVARSIDYEIRRQIQILEHGKTVVNETRSYDTQAKRTLPMRDKEAKQDYRYMPEPNLPPLRLPQLNLDPLAFRSRIPLLPHEERQALIETYGLNLEKIMQLVNANCISYFKKVMSIRPHLPVKHVINYLLTELLGLLNKDGKTIYQNHLHEDTFSEIIELRSNGRISHTACQSLITIFYQGETTSPTRVVEEKGWTMSNDSEELQRICRQIILSNPKLVASYRAGKTKVFSSLTYHLKAACNNKFDMALATTTLKLLLDDKKSDA